jgi:hypothetical protein
MGDGKVSAYVGKYVIYDQADGGSCFGRIVDEAVVNTMQGEKEVFILADRVVRYLRSADPKRFRMFYPDAIGSPNVRSPEVTKSGQIGDEDEGARMFFEARKVKGVTTLRKDKIDLERDVVDVEDMLARMRERIGGANVDTLFLALLKGRAGDRQSDAVIEGKDALDIGLAALLSSDSRIGRDLLKGAIKEKLDSRTKDGGV